MDTPWFVAGGAVPVGWANTGKWKWNFPRNSTNSSDAKTDCSLFFPFALSAEQVATATRIIESGQVVAGRYETWEKFAQVHRI